MDETILEQLAEQAAQIARQMAENLKTFGREVASLYYAKQMLDIPIPEFPSETQHTKFDNHKANEKLKKMLEEAKQKWKYASENEKRKVAEMEKVVSDGQERIKMLYR
ncbi:MAG: hypothetical protein QM610_10050 [Chitinophagaceae bacterium]